MQVGPVSAAHMSRLPAAKMTKMRTANVSLTSHVFWAISPREAQHHSRMLHVRGTSRDTNDRRNMRSRHCSRIILWHIRRPRGDERFIDRDRGVGVGVEIASMSKTNMYRVVESKNHPRGRVTCCNTNMSFTLPRRLVRRRALGGAGDSDSLIDGGAASDTSMQVENVVSNSPKASSRACSREAGCEPRKSYILNVVFAAYRRREIK